MPGRCSHEGSVTDLSAVLHALIDVKGFSLNRAYLF